MNLDLKERILMIINNGKIKWRLIELQLTYMCTVCVELRTLSVDITCLQSKNVRLIVSKALIVDIAVLRDKMSRWFVISLFPNS
jgi:hypothetical protein